MALPTPCQTPGAQYSIRIQPGRPMIDAAVVLPFTLRLSEGEAEQLEANIHNALELVLAPYFIGDNER